jgi:hypothetical protein
MTDFIIAYKTSLCFFPDKSTNFTDLQVGVILVYILKFVKIVPKINYKNFSCYPEFIILRLSEK